VQLIPGAGHAPHWETPQQFVALLTDFNGDIDGRPTVGDVWTDTDSVN
jgi:hypothetical protein